MNKYRSGLEVSIAKQLKKFRIKFDYEKLVIIRFVFSNAKAKIYKGSKTTYADWCIKYGFKFFNKTIPIKWIKEKYGTHRS